MNPTKKLPLFVVTGASGVGKSSACEVLFQNEKDYIVIENDLFWNKVYMTPENNYRPYRELSLRVCANISQAGLPVVLCCAAMPEQLEVCRERGYFTKIHYLAVVCDDNVLEERMRSGREITDTDWIQGSKDFNGWFKNRDKTVKPEITLLDNSELTPEEAAEIIDKWIRRKM